jgi:hypothetical protein
MEIWKPCFEDYQVSNFGNVRRRNGKVLKCSRHSAGYRYFQLQRNDRRVNYMVHHLVARNFIGERPQGLIIDHIDRDRTNNHIDNLRYTTYKENSINSSTYRSEITERDRTERRRILARLYYRNKKQGV